MANHRQSIADRLTHARRMKRASDLRLAAIAAERDQLRDALHLAFDWIGREPVTEWDKAHYDEVYRTCSEALRA